MLWRWNVLTFIDPPRNRPRVRAIQRGLAVFLFAFFALRSGAAEVPSAGSSSAARAVIAAAFSDTDSAKIIAVLVSGAAKQTEPADRKAILASLAGFEERTGLPLQAAKHYSEASYADPAKRDFGLLLDAARAALSANDTDQANGLVRAVLVSCFDDSILLRARVYAVWVQLASGDRAEALAQIRSCADNPVFADYIPELLFALWWTDSDAAAKKRLLDQYPKSPEAAVARGDISLSPVPFWFLIGRSPSDIAAFAAAGSGAMSPAAASRNTSVAGLTIPPESIPPSAAPDQSAKPATSVAAPVTPIAPASSPVAPGKVWQQVGFFKNRSNADDLVAKLTKVGFLPVVRTDRRASGTVYYAVIVPEDEARGTGAKLKDAGFESCLVFD
jgi:hypothetical protein